MFPDTISPKTKRVYEKIGKVAGLKNFYLAGGTALALQLGHRRSIDLDFFCYKKFVISRLKTHLSRQVKISLRAEEEGTLHIVVGGVRVSFLHYPYSLSYPKIKYEYNYLADWRDIAVMKLDAVSSRGSKKDFIDLYFLLDKRSLSSLFNIFDKKFKQIDYNKAHILKSLVYFKQAETEPMPIMIRPVKWSQVKKELVRAVEDYLAKN